MVENAKLISAEKEIVELDVVRKIQRTKSQILGQKARLLAQIQRLDELLTLFD